MSNKREATFHPMDPTEAGDLTFPAVPGPIERSLLADPEPEIVGDWAGPQAPNRHDQEIDDLRSEIDRYDDKLYLIERLVEEQAPFGSELARFRRRLLLLVRA